ncbi:unnamed protein product [Arctia plantaginis]|uniref:PiggyBac transposable element-derived protein domain-containing protein n=1 Tax=Arctia plantaginis TaxID=874455 RepID=A0A8S1B2A2_ARCPL|nr:unnamed protein product [Arctia plantaginis]CAB3255721.1 unnamed protein product [Arctia plantaginis]
MSGQRKLIPLDKIEETLESLFALSDGEESEDGHESDDRESEAIFLPPNSSDLEDILASPSSSNNGNAANFEPEDSVVPSVSGISIGRNQSETADGPNINVPINNSPVSLSISDSEDDSSEDEDWKKVLFPHDVPRNKFDDIPLKSHQNIPNKSGPHIYFRFFFTDEVLSLIAEQTNLYAAQNKQKNWVDVSNEEIQAFVGMLVLMGVHPLPNIDLYWSTDPFFCVREIADVMTVKKFKMIMKNLHLNDNTKMPQRGEPEYDKLYKIRPLIAAMNTAFQKGARNSSSQSIDECMVKFKGRSTLKQYLPNKPIKRGFKIWARCDSSTGYLFEFEVYTGKKDNDTEFGLGAAVVNSLCKVLIEEKIENAHVTFDNFFASTQLMQSLYENNIYSTATVRSNRTNLPRTLKNLMAKKGKPKLSRGQYKWRVNRNVACFTWMDTKLVNILSTAMRTQKDGRKQEVPCPLGVVEYTKRMGGVDRFDQKRGTYPVARRSRRWWMRLYYFMVDAAITNAYILYAQKVRYPMSTLQFRTLLGRNLIGTFTSRRKRVSNLPSFVSKRPKVDSRQKAKYGLPDDQRLSDVGSHLPGPLDSYRRCRACSSNANSKKSKIQCIRCEVALCIVPCFANFHKP